MVCIDKFPDKKEWSVNFNEITAYIQQGAELRKKMSVGQSTADWHVPSPSMLLLWMTDIHYGSIGTDYELLKKHFDLLENKPNVYGIIGGDTIDNFGIKHAHAGLMGDAVPPMIQAQAMTKKLVELDDKGKIGAIVYGNHEDWLTRAGYDYYQTFDTPFKAPIFDKGGVITIHVGNQEYKIGIGHKHWGVSKINITNAAKRGLEYSWPGAEVVLIGDDHQSSMEVFYRGGKKYVVVDGGTYKLFDSTGEKWGLGPAGHPGYAIYLSGKHKSIEVVSDPFEGVKLL